MTEIEYEVREQDLIAFNEHLLQESKPMQKALRRHQVIVPGLLSVAVLVLWFLYQETTAAILFMILAMAWALLTPSYFRWSTRRQLRRLYSDEEKACILGRYALRIEPKHLVEVAPGGESRVEWSSVLRVESTKKYAFIFLSVNTALIVPRDTVSKGDLHEFVRQADARIEAAE